MSNDINPVQQRLPFLQLTFFSIQHALAMFGSSVLVPLLFHISPSIILIMNGVGTLLFIAITKGKIPSYLGSSFAFIAPVLIIQARLGYAYALGGFFIAGVALIGVSYLLKINQGKWFNVLFPAALMGPVISIIGLSLFPVAVHMGGWDGHNIKAQTLSLATFIIVLLLMWIGKGIFKLFPILIGVVIAYIIAYFMHMVDFTAVKEAPFFSLPHIILPRWSFIAIISILPAVLVVMVEHIGHFYLTENIIQQPISKDPGLWRSVRGDGISTVLSSIVGSVPTTNYGENIGVMVITGIFNVWVMAGAAVISIILGFLGKFSVLIQSIPTALLGGISSVLFSVIAVSGFRILITHKVDYGKSKNLVLTAVVFFVGMSNISVNIGQIQWSGVVLATLVGLFVNLLYILRDYVFNKWLFQE